MKLIYSDKKTQSLCEDYKTAVKKLNKDVADKLMVLIQLLESFVALGDLSSLPQYRLHGLTGNRANQYSLVIRKGTKWRLIVYPLDENEQLLTDKSNEKEMLSKAVVVEVVEVSEHYD
jgi:plasmid maintenance system killer protein